MKKIIHVFILVMFLNGCAANRIENYLKPTPFYGIETERRDLFTDFLAKLEIGMLEKETISLANPLVEKSIVRINRVCVDQDTNLWSCIFFAANYADRHNFKLTFIKGKLAKWDY